MHSSRKNFALSILLFSAACLYAQEFRSTLTGLVTDPSGAVIPKAAVEAVNRDTQQKYFVTTSSKGDYYIPYMLPGTYTVTVTAPGMKKSTQNDVVLDASQPRALNFQMEIGSSAQTVEVTGVAPLLESANGSGGTILTAREMQDVPLNGRQVYMLIGTTPGSQFTTTQFGANGNSGTRGWDVTNAYTIGGGVANYQQFTLNGTNMTIQYSFQNQGTGTWEIAPNVDALQEVNVMSQTYDARYGRTGGGTVNEVMKSGTNQFHGTAYDYFQNGHLDSNNFQNNVTGIAKQMVHTNQFGGTVGGPVKKDKIFFFGSFEGYKQSIPFSVVANTVPAYLRPTANGVNFSNTAQSGILYDVFDPNTTVCTASGGTLTSCSGNKYARTMFPGDTIPASRINPIGAAILALYTLPNSGGASLSNNLVTQAPDVYAYYQPMVRVDYDTSDKTRWYSMFVFQRGTENRNTNGLTGVAEMGNINHIRQDLTASQDMTHIFSPTLVADFKLSFSRFLDFQDNGNLGAAVNPTSIGLNMPNIPSTTLKDLPQITLNGFASAVGNQVQNDVWNNMIFDNDWTKTKGNHTIHFGGEIGEYQLADPLYVGSANGQFTFGSTNTQYNPTTTNACPGCGATVHDNISVADLLLGDPTTASNVAWNNTFFDYYPTWALYVQDDWKFSKRLTLNIGFRYDVQLGTRERHNYLNRGVCMTCLNPITNNPTFQANVAADSAAWTAAGISPSLIYPAYGGLEFGGVNGQQKDGYNTDWTNFEPRFGFAFQMDPKTVLRGGYGIEYAPGLEGGTMIGATQSTSYTASLNGGITPTNYFASGTPFPNAALAPTGSSLGFLTNLGNQLNVDFPQRRLPRSQTFSLGVQRELPWQMVLDVKYAGNYTDRLRNGTASAPGSIWLNGTMPLSQYEQAIINPNYFNKQVPNPYYGVAPVNSTRGASPTISAEQLLTPYSDFNLIGQSDDPIGKERYNALEVKLTKRLVGAGGKTGGLSFRLAYTYSKTMEDSGYTNGWPYQDANLLYELAPTDRTHVFTMTTEWALPVGHGAPWMAHGVLGQVVNDWNINYVASVQTGTPLGISQGYTYECNHPYAPDGGSTNTDYLYNVYPFTYTNFITGATNQTSSGGCWIPNGSLSQYFLNSLPQRIGQVRTPTEPNLDVSVSKNFSIWESVRLQFRADAFNLLNTPLRPVVQNSPTAGPPVYSGGVWSGFGTVSDLQYNFPRIIQLSLKVLF